MTTGERSYLSYRSMWKFVGSGQGEWTSSKPFTSLNWSPLLHGCSLPKLGNKRTECVTSLPQGLSLKQQQLETLLPMLQHFAILYKSQAVVAKGGNRLRSSAYLSSELLRPPSWGSLGHCYCPGASRCPWSKAQNMDTLLIYKCPRQRRESL